MARNLTVMRPATVGRCTAVSKGDLYEDEDELRTPRIGVDEDAKAEATKTGLTKSAWAKTRELMRSRPRSAMLHPMTRTLSVHPLEAPVPTPATPVVEGCGALVEIDLDTGVVRSLCEYGARRVSLRLALGQFGALVTTASVVAAEVSTIAPG
ncbi:uncharacterized protein LAESUDRAFT_759934 [Laetiporus sulphureus 93-53]|uniref:Uncharacterized protein n=1 Tax=Laetiporus sulphureus 93-53 TaxID=1314785 RepID=A0A165DV65_9APHY|nr:uncharacterized protein LAESUDRAFT_759934 [Laetiporus sulphureus 93-53]KZT05690.1 hypothetical protein LAESUDRAFT_759934 [Laetiporus sulphureus 93-53]